MDNSFTNALNRHGPHAHYEPPVLAQAREYCKRLTLSHYENFSVASLLLPRRLLPHFHAIYAYCRWADDLADEVGSGEESLALLAWWRQELLACYAGKPRHPVMVALEPTIQKFQIPQAPFLNLLTAFEQDQRVKQYDTYSDLLAYCVNSANPVGHLVLHLGEVFDRERADLSDRICTGLQLANFWQDVTRDQDIGRIYLPREDLDRFGCSIEDIAERRFTPEFGQLLRFEVERTRQLFVEGLPLVARMPADLQADIELFVRGGQAILGKIEQNNYNVLTSRPALTRWEKGSLILGVGWRGLRGWLPRW